MATTKVGICQWCHDLIWSDQEYVKAKQPPDVLAVITGRATIKLYHKGPCPTRNPFARDVQE